MKLAFCLFKFFPYGGLQRDFLRIAKACHDRGHAIHVYTMAWEGEQLPHFSVHILPAKGLTNHGRCKSFSGLLARELEKGHFDAVIGFNKMPGLDVYFAADPCFASKYAGKSILSRLTGRYRVYSAMERAVFDRDANTKILLLTGEEKQNYIRCYQTPDERFYLLPPGINPSDYQLSNPEEVRSQIRQQLDVGMQDLLLLMVGSGFKTKGVDRSIRALASLPAELRSRARLFVVGRGDSAPFEKLSAKLGISRQVSFLGTRNDVPAFLVAADILLHPSYTEAAGMVLLEAMLAGLPILCSEVCGYATHVKSAGSGQLIPEPFEQRTMNNLLLHMLAAADERKSWSRNGLEYVAKTDISGLPDQAVQIIESVTR
ncbi:glycosyltransferase family 4 protein [Geobacter benzoatilyticus]|uniref:Glycosyltransferase family 4 protein n=1 Tax=Geobacter benzoatilyticus TaxID=2815309 RepID=A0ABX7Q2B2_9BACT|nr:glycosyltransferase family 4 protein [Geobacter benzoatilyticus]QSV45568.1 glycosyltransferase family 4 protein [Geobacter benzoatilyticus]